VRRIYSPQRWSLPQQRFGMIHRSLDRFQICFGEAIARKSRDRDWAGRLAVEAEDQMKRSGSKA
jgi:hypothetical protein